MHRHDLDTIAAFADGSLDPLQQDKARHLVDTCAECRDEFDAQKTIIDVLSNIQPASLTDLERAQLHQTLAHYAVEPRRPKAWLIWAPRVAVAAAALAFVGTFGVLFLGGQNDSGGDAADTAVAEAAPEVTEAAAASSGLQQSLDQGAAAAEAPAAEEEAPAAADDARILDSEIAYFFLGEIGSLDDIDDARFSPELEESTTPADVSRDTFECIDRAVEMYEVGAAGLARFNEEPVEVFFTADGHVVFDQATCAVLRVVDSADE